MGIKAKVSILLAAEKPAANCSPKLLMRAWSTSTATASWHCWMPEGTPSRSTRRRRGFSIASRKGRMEK